MPDIALFLFQQIGPAALIILFGYLADYVSTTTLKDEVIQWVTRNRRVRFNRRTVGRLLKLALDGFLHRIYGHSLFSFSFFVRSCGVTALFVALAFFLQFLFFDDVDQQFLSLGSSASVILITFLSLLFFTCILDYISNIQTISLLRMAAASGRRLDIVVIFIADIILTISLFTFLFPTAVVISLLLTEPLRASQKITFNVLPKEASTPFLLEQKLNDNNSLKPGGLYIVNEKGRSIVLPYSIASDQTEKEMDLLIELISSQYSVSVVNKSTNTFTLEISARPIKLSWHTIKYMYYAGYVESNITRDAFLVVARLEPMYVEASDIYSRVWGGYSYQYGVQRDPSRAPFMVKCVSQEVRVIRQADVSQSNCMPLATLAAGVFSEPLWSLRLVLAAGQKFPLSPFFFSSFATSILYYAVLMLIMSGAIISNLMESTFSTNYFEIKSRPFIVLSLLMFPFFLLVGLVIKFISG